MSYEIDSVTDFVDGGRKQLKISPRPNPMAVYGCAWKIVLDHGMQELTTLLLAGKLGGKETGMLLHLINRMGVGNTIHLSQKELAGEFGVSIAYVSKVLIKLRALDLIRGTMLNPLIVVKCRTDDYPPLLATWNGLRKDNNEPLAFGHNGEQSNG